MNNFNQWKARISVRRIDKGFTLWSLHPFITKPAIVVTLQCVQLRVTIWNKVACDAASCFNKLWELSQKTPQTQKPPLLRTAQSARHPPKFHGIICFPKQIHSEMWMTPLRHTHTVKCGSLPSGTHKSIQELWVTWYYPDNNLLEDTQLSDWKRW